MWSRLRNVLGLLLLMAAGLIALGAIGSPRAINQGGSASPEYARPARTDGKRIAQGAKSGGEAATFTQRVEDNAFHLPVFLAS